MVESFYLSSLIDCQCSQWSGDNGSPDYYSLKFYKSIFWNQPGQQKRTKVNLCKLKASSDKINFEDNCGNNLTGLLLFVQKQINLLIQMNISELRKWPPCWPRCRGSPAISLRSTRFEREMFSTIQNATKAGTLLFPTKIICTLALSILSFHSTCCCSMLRSDTYMSNYTTWPQKSVLVISIITKC